MGLFTFGFYSDAALTTEITSAIQFVTDVDNPGPVTKTVYFGSPLANRRLLSSVGPTLAIGIVDSAAGGAAVGDVKLAVSLAGIETAVAGAGLDLGAEVIGGPGNAIEIFIRVQASTNPALGASLDISLEVNNMAEWQV